jgi:hypothetical protein
MKQNPSLDPTAATAEAATAPSRSGTSPILVAPEEAWADRSEEVHHTREVGRSCPGLSRAAQRMVATDADARGRQPGEGGGRLLVEEEDELMGEAAG